MVAVAPVLDLSLQRLLGGAGINQAITCTGATLAHLAHTLERLLLARQTPALLLACFQDTQPWEPEQPPFRPGAARHTVIFSPDAPPADPSPGLTHVRLPRGNPLQQEWFIVLVSPFGSMALAARELPAPAGAGGERRFSALLSFLPAQVEQAVELLTQAISVYRPDRLDTLRAIIGALPVQAPDPLLVTSLFSEMLGFEERQRQQVCEREQALAQQLRWREDVTATIVHDMRVPLQNLLMALDLLQIEQRSSSPEVRELMAEARRDTNSLRLLIQLIADTQHLDAQQFTLRCQPIVPERLVSDALAPLRHRIGQHKIDLEEQYDERVTALWGDAHLLVRLIQNLVVNALKFTPTGGRISVRVLHQPDGGALLQVADTGDGIGAAVLPHIFERYFQAKPEDRRGSGMGLYFCRLVAEAHGGQVRAESQLGRGTTISVLLSPRPPEQAPAQP
jgi:signal transduction histidine kinase